MRTEQNPLAILSIDHLEFTVDTLDGPTRALFEDMGFCKVCESEGKELLAQGQIRFLLNACPTGHHREYLRRHGEGVSKISFLVRNAHQAVETAVQRGASGTYSTNSWNAPSGHQHLSARR